MRPWACLRIAELLFLTACSREFLSESAKRLTIRAGVNARDTLMVRDTATLAIEITDENGHAITGIEVDWHSDSLSLLELRSVPKSSGSLADSLTSLLSVRAIAHARGSAVVTATVDRPGFE